ncbi:MAG: hypothetical protein WA485_26920 [Candidatus Sulfotelmatobacter sp.]
MSLSVQKIANGELWVRTGTIPFSSALTGRSNVRIKIRMYLESGARLAVPHAARNWVVLIRRFVDGQLHQGSTGANLAGVLKEVLLSEFSQLWLTNTCPDYVQKHNPATANAR